MTFKNIIKTIEPLLRLIAILAGSYFAFVAFGTILNYSESFADAISIILFAE